MKSNRRATTLFELILVLSIIVVASAISVPSLQSMHGYYKLNGAVDSVRSAWAEARAQAILEGRPYRFSVQPDGRAYRVSPDQDDQSSGQGTHNDPDSPSLVLEQSLPAGVRFAINGEGGVAPADEREDFSLDEKPVQGGNWSTVVVFEHDGTSHDDVQIRFQVTGCRPMVLHLRGMTGDSYVETEAH